MEQSFKVYRLEHEHTPNKNSSLVKMGCYIHSDEVLEKMWWYDEMLRKHSNLDIHPNIWIDGFRLTGNFFCAFDSVEKLKDWFGEYLQYLTDWGFVVREYTLNETYVTGKSGKQVMFAVHTIIESKIISLECLVD